MAVKQRVLDSETRVVGKALAINKLQKPCYQQDEQRKDTEGDKVNRILSWSFPDNKKTIIHKDIKTAMLLQIGIAVFISCCNR